MQAERGSAAKRTLKKEKGQAVEAKASRLPSMGNKMWSISGVVLLFIARGVNALPSSAVTLLEPAAPHPVGKTSVVAAAVDDDTPTLDLQTASFLELERKPHKTARSSLAILQDLMQLEADIQRVEHKPRRGLPGAFERRLNWDNGAPIDDGLVYLLTCVFDGTTDGLSDTVPAEAAERDTFKGELGRKGSGVRLPTQFTSGGYVEYSVQVAAPRFINGDNEGAGAERLIIRTTPGTCPTLAL